MSSPEILYYSFSSVQFSLSVKSNSLRPHESQPGLPVHDQLLEFTQTHAHWVSDAIQTSHSLSSPSPPAPNPSQSQGLFQWVNSLHEVAKILEFQLQHHVESRNIEPMNTEGRLYLHCIATSQCPIIFYMAVLDCNLKHDQHPQKAPSWPLPANVSPEVTTILPPMIMGRFCLLLNFK